MHSQGLKIRPLLILLREFSSPSIHSQRQLRGSMVSYITSSGQTCKIPVLLSGLLWLQGWDIENTAISLYIFLAMLSVILHCVIELGVCYKKAKTLSCSYEKTLVCDFSQRRNWSYYAINWVNRVPHKRVWKWNCPPWEFYMKINLKSIKSQHAAP